MSNKEFRIMKFYPLKWNDVHLPIHHHGQYIEEWWDPDLFPWGAVGTLIRYYPEYFNIWWDPDRFSWKPRTCLLMIRHLGHHLTEWWDPDRFPWTKCAYYLIRESGNRFLFWWNAERFPWEGNWNGQTAAELLAMYCPDYLPYWYDPERLIWTEDLCKLLIRHCAQYQDIWGTDTLLYQLNR